MNKMFDRPLFKKKLVQKTEFDQTVVSEFNKDEDSRVELWAGYRNYIKKIWATYYWPVKLLFALDRRISLQKSRLDLVRTLKNCRTLPVPIEEILANAKILTQNKLNLVKHSDKIDPLLNNNTLFAIIPQQNEIAAICKDNIKKAKGFIKILKPLFKSQNKLKILEVGCGSGYLAYAIASQEVGNIIGIDVEFPVYASIAEQPLIVDKFSRLNPNVNNNCLLDSVDVHNLKFKENSFDLVYSNSVLEHISGIKRAIEEMYRVLKPGGIAYHIYDPWFSPRGGHSLCTIDFPWGHVYLSPSEFENYILKYRFYEYQHAIPFYRDYFPQQKPVLKIMEKFFLDTGFQIIRWVDHQSTYSHHIKFLQNNQYQEIESRYPQCSIRDLLTYSCNMILKKV